MSETAERETELVAGVIEGITQKKADTWQVTVKPEGSQYTKNLWTKDSELVTALTAKIGQAGAFVCGASYWTNQSGTQVRSLWINEAADRERMDDLHVDMRQNANASPSAAPKDAMTKEDWARKDSAIHKMACIKTAADALKHTLPSDPSEEDLRKFLERERTLSTAWHRSVIAERDGEEPPF